mgnify:FL=1
MDEYETRETVELHWVNWTNIDPDDSEADYRSDGEGRRRPHGMIRIGHLSDFHLGKPLDDAEGPARAEAWMSAMREVDCDVVVISGDLVEKPGNRVGLLRARHILESSDVPWVVVPGNHDVAEPGQTGAFEGLFGSYPRVEHHAGVEFILLDSLRGLPSDQRSPFERLDAARHGSYSNGRVGADQLKYIEGQLRGSYRPRVLVLHHHLADEQAVTGEDADDGVPKQLMRPLEDADQVLDWADAHGIGIAFHGHIHRWWPAYRRRDVVVFNSGSSTRGRPVPRARVVEIQGNGELTAIGTLALGEEQT